MAASPESHLSPAVQSWYFYPHRSHVWDLNLGVQFRISPPLPPGAKRGCHAPLRGEGRAVWWPLAGPPRAVFRLSITRDSLTPQHAKTQFPVTWACVGKINSETEIHSLALISNYLASLVTCPSPIHMIRILTNKHQGGSRLRFTVEPPPSLFGAAVLGARPAGGWGCSRSRSVSPDHSQLGQQRGCHLPNTHLRPSSPSVTGSLFAREGPSASSFMRM